MRIRTWLFSIALLLGASFPAAAQMTTISSTGVTDSAGITYIGGSYRIQLGANTTGQPLYFQGAPLPNGLTQFSGTLSSTGSFSISIPSSAYILAGQNGPANLVQWNFTVCAVGNTGCYSVNSLVSGSTDDLTSTINAGAVALTFNIPGIPPGPTSDCVVGTGTAPPNQKWANCVSSGGGVSSAAGTPNQINVNGGTSPQTGAVTFSLPSTLIAPGTIAATGSVSSSADGTNAGYLDLVGNTANPTLIANTFGILGPTVASFTAYAWQVPSTAPGTNTVPEFGAASGPVSPITYLGVNGSGAGLPTGPSTTVTTDLVSYTGTGGQQQDSGIASATVATLSGTQTITNKTFGATSFTGLVTGNQNSLGSNYTDGVELSNTTAATNSQNQNSPCLHLSGQGWGGSATQSEDWQLCVQSENGYSFLSFNASAGGTPSQVISMSNTGAMTAGGGFFSSLSNQLMQNETSATVASGTTIAPTTPMVITSGTTSIATITLPSGFTTGCFDLIPSGTQATTTAGNIAAVYTLTSGTLYRVCYNGTKWYVK